MLLLSLVVFDGMAGEQRCQHPLRAIEGFFLEHHFLRSWGVVLFVLGSA